jgi:large subunit ribosomal protein L21e
MAKKKGGMRRRTRNTFKKGIRQKGKISITNFFNEFKKGDAVRLKADSSVHHGLYFHRFHGRAGIVQAKKGRCYEVLIKDLNKQKMLIVHPAHLQRLK